MKKLQLYVVYDGFDCLLRTTDYYEAVRFCTLRADGGKDRLRVERYNRSKHSALDARALKKTVG